MTTRKRFAGVRSQLIDYQERSESMLPIQQMNNGEAWRTMITFED